MIKINCGCANKVFKGWTNVDIVDYSSYAEAAGAEFVQASAADYLEGLPSESVDVVSAIHMLDHLDPFEARAFLAQAYRVLKPGGILRVEVEDFALIIAIWQAGRMDVFYPQQPPTYRGAQSDFQVAYLLLGNLAGTPEYTGHKMFYTKASLGLLLVEHGFASEHVFDYRTPESLIDGWTEDQDTQLSHTIVMEAVK